MHSLLQAAEVVERLLRATAQLLTSWEATILVWHSLGTPILAITYEWVPRASPIRWRTAEGHAATMLSGDRMARIRWPTTWTASRIWSGVPVRSKEMISMRLSIFTIV